MFWSLDNVYYRGIVAEERNGNQPVVYDDGGNETLDFSNETWCYVLSAKLLSVCALSIRLNSDMPQTLASIFDYFGNKPFLRYQAQALPDYALLSAHLDEGQAFKRTVKVT